MMINLELTIRISSDDDTKLIILQVSSILKGGVVYRPVPAICVTNTLKIFDLALAYTNLLVEIYVLTLPAFLRGKQLFNISILNLRTYPPHISEGEKTFQYLNFNRQINW